MWVLSRDQVRQAFDNGDVFLDSRTDDQFMGLNKHPKAKVLGIITGSINVPQDWLTHGGKGTFRDLPALEVDHEKAGNSQSIERDYLLQHRPLGEYRLVCLERTSGKSECEDVRWIVTGLDRGRFSYGTKNQNLTRSA